MTSTWRRYSEPRRHHGAQQRTWHGTLILIGQPAEETISGAKKMIDDGLMTRFPKPDVALALHVGNELPAGKSESAPAIDCQMPIPCA